MCYGIWVIGLKSYLKYSKVKRPAAGLLPGVGPTITGPLRLSSRSPTAGEDTPHKTSQGQPGFTSHQTSLLHILLVISTAVMYGNFVVNVGEVFFSNVMR